MLKRRLGRTEFQASVVGFGSIPVGRLPVEDGVRVVRRALELGVNFIDTARSYGNSEAAIGQAIKGLRDNLIIATKSHFRTKREVAESIETSRRLLGVQTIDLMQLHSVDSEEVLRQCLSRGGAFEAMKESRRDGRGRFLGISGHQPQVLISALKTGEFDTVLASYNLSNTAADRELFPLAAELDIGVIVMKPLDGGFLGVPPEAVKFQVADRATSTAEAALRFVLSNPRVTTAIPGLGTIAQVEEDVPLGYLPQEMPTEEAAHLQGRAKEVGRTFCEGCGYCLELCPQHIAIDRVFRFQVFYEQYGLRDLARNTYREYYQAAVESCTECRSCMERCPAQLDIPARLKEAHALLASESRGANPSGLLPRCGDSTRSRPHFSTLKPMH